MTLIEEAIIRISTISTSTISKGIVGGDPSDDPPAGLENYIFQDGNNYVFQDANNYIFRSS